MRTLWNTPRSLLLGALTWGAMGCLGAVDGEGREIASSEAELSSGSVVALVAEHSGLAADVQGNSKEPGAALQQWTAGDKPNQHFALRTSGSDYALVAEHSGLCLHVASSSQDNGARITQEACTGGANQRFQLRALDGGRYQVVAKHSDKCLDVKGKSTEKGAAVQQWKCGSGKNQAWRIHEVGTGEPAPDPDPKPPGNKKWGNAVVTVYTFQDNSACNSVMTSSGRPLVPYVSVALPSRYLKSGGPFKLGDQIYVSFLAGRTMPNGKKHTGWVRIDDFCGDGGDDSYCFQNGQPNVDLYAGDWAQSGMTCHASNPNKQGSGSFSGPGGDGQEDTEVRFGPAPSGQFVSSYGGRAMGTGRCGNCGDGKKVQPPACWHYDPGSINREYCDCDNSNGTNNQCN